MKIIMTALAPIAHNAFGPSTGNATLFRRAKLANGKSAPVVSGNALRGVMRRIVMRDLLSRCGLGVESDGWDALYAAICNGGHLSGSETSLDPKAVKALRAAVPPLSVFGAALRTWMLAGRIRVGFLWPQCAEAFEVGVVSCGSMHAEDLLDDVSHCRHADREFQNPEVSGVTPMPTTVESLKTGTVLECDILFDNVATDVERGVVAHALNNLHAIGGKSGGGFGRVMVKHDGDDRVYIDWLANLGAITECSKELQDLARHLKGEKKSKKAKEEPCES